MRGDALINKQHRRALPFDTFLLGEGGEKGGKEKDLETKDGQKARDGRH